MSILPRTPRVLAVTLSPASRRYLDTATAGFDVDPAEAIDAIIRVWAAERGAWRERRKEQIAQAVREPAPVLTLVPPQPPDIQ